MSRPTSFHVRHDLTPTYTHELLSLLLAMPVGCTQQELQGAAHFNGYQVRLRKDYYKLLRSLVELDVLIEEGNRYRLTQPGQVIARIALYERDLLPDFIHFLYYTGFDLDSSKRFSWSYRQVCDSLWNTAPSSIHRDRLVNLITREATLSFDTNGISFSTSSVAGILNWLTELSPPCIIKQDSGQKFTRREFCSVELFALALDHTFKSLRQPEVHSIPLSSEVRETICRICLIVPEAFPEMLYQTEINFDNIQIRRERGDRVSIENFSWNSLEENR